MKTNKDTGGQQGFVSIFTVLFFMVLITVITIGFLRIVISEQGQSQSNSLTASALDAAKAGIEDGKRALLAYMNTTDPTLKAQLASILNNPAAGCKDLYGNPSVANALGLDLSGKVEGASNLNESYSCLIVSPLSPDYQGSAGASTSTIVPLKAAGNFANIQVMWHDNADDGAVNWPIGTPTGAFPTQAAWNTAKSGKKTAEYLRLELIKTANENTSGDPANNQITPSGVTSSVVYLTPAQAGNTANFGLPQPNISPVLCKTSGASQFACSVSLPVTGDGTSQYYLRVTPLYGPTHFVVCLESCSAPVDFNGAQPIIDSTGQAADVFRRIKARISLGSQVSLPEFSLESGHSVCKAFSVSDKIDTSNGDGAGCSVP